MLTLYGCQSKLPSVHVFVYDLSDPFIEGLSRMLESEGKKHFEMVIHDGFNSQIIQNELIVKSLEDSPDLIIVNPVDRLGAYTIIEKAKEKDIPVIFFNREPLKRDLDLYDHAFYVGSDPRESGIFQASMISTLFGGNPNNLNERDSNQDQVIQMVIFKGEQGHQDAELRTDYVQSTLIDMGFEIEVTHVIVANWNEIEAYHKALELFEDNYSSIEVIVSNNDAMALGIIRAMHEYHEELLKQNDEHQPYSIPIFGVDGIPRAIEMIDMGELNGTVINDASNQSSAIINLALAILSNDLDSLEYDLVDNHYIWIPYKKLN